MHPQGIRKLHCLPYKYKMQGVLNKYFAMLLKDFDNNVTVLKHCMNSLLLHNVPWKFKLSWPENWYLLSLLESWHLRNETKISNHKCKKRQRTKTTKKKKKKKKKIPKSICYCSACKSDSWNPEDSSLKVPVSHLVHSTPLFFILIWAGYSQRIILINIRKWSLIKRNIFWPNSRCRNYTLLFWILW